MKPPDFLDVLPRGAAVVDRVALRQGPRRELLQGLQGLGLRHAGEGHALDGGAVELLEVVQRLRDRLGDDLGHRRQRHRRAVGGADVIVEDLVDVLPRTLLDLRDHLVGAAVEREVVDVAAAQHRAQRGADVAHLEAELRGLVAIDHDRGLRRVDLEIGVEEDEAAGGERLLQELLRHVVQRLERAGRVDHELDRQAGRAGQRRRLEGHDLRAGDAGELALHDRLQLVGGHRALVPRLQDVARDRLAGHVELEDVVGLLVAGADVVDLRAR